MPEQRPTQSTAYWTCPQCGFVAPDEKTKIDHEKTHMSAKPQMPEKPRTPEKEPVAR